MDTTNFSNDTSSLEIGVWDGLSNEFYIRIENESGSETIGFPKADLLNFLVSVAKMVKNEGLFGDYVYLKGREEGFRCNVFGEYVELYYYDYISSRDKSVSLVVEKEMVDDFLAWLSQIVKELKN